MRTKLAVHFRLLSTAEGGRKTPVWSDYRPQFYFDGNDYDCRVYFDQSQVVCPGDSTNAEIRLSLYASTTLSGMLRPGSEFAIREGSKVVATGTVDSVAEMPDDAC